MVHMERYLSKGDVAKRLGLVPATVKALVARGRLPVAARTEGGIQLFRAADVERLAAEREARRDTKEEDPDAGRG
jgi:DNA-binding transcriptional MerR regulator